MSKLSVPDIRQPSPRTVDFSPHPQVTSNLVCHYLLPGRSCDKRLGTPRSIPLIYSFLLLLLLRLILMHGIVASKIYLYIDALHTVCKLSEPVGAV